MSIDWPASAHISSASNAELFELKNTEERLRQFWLAHLGNMYKRVTGVKSAHNACRAMITDKL